MGAAPLFLVCPVARRTRTLEDLRDGGYPDGFILPPDEDGGIVVTLPDGGTGICYITPCQGKLYACGNCTDDDGDGLVDSYDPACLGPCQNNDAGFLGASPPMVSP